MTHIQTPDEFYTAFEEEVLNILEDEGGAAGLGREDLEVYWNKKQPLKCDADYLQTVFWQCSPIRYPEDVIAFERVFKRAFDLKHDIRWIGMLVTFKTPGEPDTGGREDAAFLVHNEDLDAISVELRLDLGFRWMFDVFGNETRRLYPLHFRRPYSLAEEVSQENARKEMAARWPQVSP